MSHCSINTPVCVSNILMNLSKAIKRSNSASFGLPSGFSIKGTTSTSRKGDANEEAVEPIT